MALTLKQEAFVDEYFKHDGNCYAAALAAGYTVPSARRASQWIAENSKVKNSREYKAELAEAINERREKLKSERVADAQEILEFHTRVLRGETSETVLIVTGEGDGFSKVDRYEKPPSIRDKQSSADALAKVFGMLGNKLSIEGSVPIVICGSDALE